MKEMKKYYLYRITIWNKEGTDEIEAFETNKRKEAINWLKKNFRSMPEGSYADFQEWKSKSEYSDWDGDFYYLVNGSIKTQFGGLLK